MMYDPQIMGGKSVVQSMWHGELVSWKALYNPWGMGGKYVVQPMWHGWVNHCTTHVAWTGKVLYNSRFSHAARVIVTSLFPCGMGKKSLNGVSANPKATCIVTPSQPIDSTTPRLVSRHHSNVQSCSWTHQNPINLFSPLFFHLISL